LPGSKRKKRKGGSKSRKRKKRGKETLKSLEFIEKKELLNTPRRKKKLLLEAT
tara:strand:- start:238 stop:396 length:159 start_codon:yes stop_codon:yes gene_type:complete